MSAEPLSLERLDSLQFWIAEQIQSPRGLGRSSAITDQASQRLTGNERLLPIEQLEIYRQQYWLRHSSSLVEDFPGLGGILSQRAWEKLVEGYLAAHAPEGWTLRDLGRHLPAYIAEAADLPHQALCLDMARLEWAFIELFDAAEAPPLDLKKLASLPANSLEAGSIVLHPALVLLEVQYPVATLRQQLVAHAEASHSEAVPIPEPDPRQLVLYRGQNLRLYHRPVPPEAFALLQAMQRGLSLVGACEYALETAPNQGESLQQNVGNWFGQWSRRGWIVDVIPQLAEPASTEPPPLS